MADIPVLIAGAGPTGLVLALWLTKLGVRVRIIDKTAGPGTTSRALAVQVRTLEQYSQVDLAEAVIERGVKVAAANLWVKVRKAARVPLGEIGTQLTPFPFVLMFPQDAHERLLLERLDALGVQVERRTELLRFEPHAEHISAVLKKPDGSEETVTAAYLAGCDGAHSKVRETLGIGFPGGTYEGLFYVADVEATGALTNHELHADLDEADLLLVFPLKGQGNLRLIGTVRDDPSRGERELTFADVSPRAIEHLQLKIEKVNWFSTYRVHHRVAQAFRSGRAFLLGDAAHIHSPVGGQGMNTGIGDAINLAWKLAAVLNGRATAGLLDTYEPERIAFAQRLVKTTDRVFTFVTARGRFARFVRTRIVPRLLALLFRFTWMRNFAFRTVSQTGIQYRHSALSHGTAGLVSGGDRLPWIESENNFATLTALDWQVHVYGEPQPGLAEVCTALKLPLHVFSWKKEMNRPGLRRDALYLIRPDGYAALAEPSGNPQALKLYFANHGLTR